MSGVKTRSDFITKFNVGTKEPFRLGLATTASTIGAAVGTVVAGFTQDGIGRKMSLVLASVVYMGGALISVTSEVRC